MASLTFFPDKKLVKEFLSYFGLAQKKPDLSFLSELIRCFAHLPYENITKILKVNEGHQDDARLRLPDEVWRDFREKGSGGTCFSLTFFFHFLCHELGFVVHPILADRSYGKNTHCALVVFLEGERYLVDPGFLIHQPIPLPRLDGVLFPTSFNTVILTAYGKDHYDLHTLHQKIKKWRCRYKAKPVLWEKFFKVWRDSFNWPGMRSILITTISGGDHLYLHNSQLRVISQEGVQKKKITEPEKLLPFFSMDISLIQQAFDVIK